MILYEDPLIEVTFDPRSRGDWRVTCRGDFVARYYYRPNAIACAERIYIAMKRRALISPAPAGAAAPERGERSADMLSGTLVPRVTRITDGTVTATVKVATDSFVIATTDSGAEVSVARADERWNLAFVRPTTLNIVRDWVVYDVNGNRVDGYKFKSRAMRNNLARFAGTGFWLGKASTGRFTWVDA